jgi:molybdopterin converting factor subunit 1
MRITVQLFARAKDLAGTDRLELELSAGASVNELRQQLAKQWPALANLLARCAIAVNEEFTDDRGSLRESDAIAILPPVSGG